MQLKNNDTNPSFFVIGIQSRAQLLVIGRGGNLHGPLPAIENTDRKFGGPQNDEYRFFPNQILFGNDPDLILYLIGQLFDLAVQLRVEVLNFQFRHIIDATENAGIDLILQSLLFFIQFLLLNL